jgi:putative membrane protein
VNRLGTLALALLIGGCATRPQEPHPPPRLPPPAEPVLPAQSPADYLRTAAEYDLFVERASELVLRRSPPPRTRALAERLLREHRGLSAQLSFAGRRLNLLPAPVLGSRHELWLRQLATTASLEQVYWQDMISAHREILARHRAFARAGRSPTLKTVAAHAVEVEQAHLEMLPPR